MVDRLLLVVKNPLLTFLVGGVGGGVLAGNMSLSADIEVPEVTVSKGRILSYTSGKDVAWNMVSSHYKTSVDTLSTKSKEANEAFETDDPETRKVHARAQRMAQRTVQYAQRTSSCPPTAYHLHLPPPLLPRPVCPCLCCSASLER